MSHNTCNDAGMLALLHGIVEDVMAIEFEQEEQLNQRLIRPPQSSTFARGLIKMHLVKNDRQASIFLIVVAIIFLAVTGLLISYIHKVSSPSGSTSYQLPPDVQSALSQQINLH